jgi:hypothetical protein
VSNFFLGEKSERRKAVDNSAEEIGPVQLFPYDFWELLRKEYDSERFAFPHQGCFNFYFYK